MRLPWPFGRAQRSPSEGDAASSGATGGGSARPDGTGAPERGPGDAWRSLPPLAETVGPPPLVAPNRPFAAALAGSEPPAPILAPLSHGRSLEAPRGLIAGVTKPVAASRGPELPKPVQRSPLQSRRDAGLDVDGSSVDDPMPEVAPVAPATPAAAPVGSPLAPAPIRRLEATSAATTRSAAKDLTRAPELVALAKPLGLVGPARAAIAGVQRAPDPTPSPEPIRPAAIPAPMAEPMPAPRPVPDRDRPRLSIGQARRLGLGSPIASGPIAASAPPFAGSAAAPAAQAMTAARPAPDLAPTGIQRAPETEAPDMPLAVRPAPATPVEAVPASIPPTGLVGATSSLPAPVPARLLGPAAPTPAGSSTPIVSAQPLRARVQRAPLTLPARPMEPSGSGTTVVAPGSVAGPAGAPVKVHRDDGAARLSKSLDARSFTHGGDIYLPASHGPLSSGKGRSLLAHELTHVTQQRRLGSSLPEEHTPHGKALEAEAVAAERGADMPLAAPPALPQGKAATPPPAAAADLSTPAPIHASSGGPAASTTGPAQRAPSNNGGEDAGNGRRTHSEQELEDLAGQLYARIGRQLRRELLVDRERAGFAMDLG